MNTQIPSIRFKYGWLIAGEASHILNEVRGDGTKLREYPEYEAIAQKYENWWRPVGSQILSAMTDILQLEFHQNEIDIYVVPWFGAISDPLILGPAFKSQDEVVNIITHELLHRLLSENNITDYNHDYISSWRDLFGEHDFNTLVHIPVHASMKMLYLDKLNRADLLELDRRSVKDNQPYVDAWSYVDDNGYETIINKLVDWYKSPNGSS